MAGVAQPMETPDQRAVWESIGDSFHATRNRTWSHVEAFLDGFEASARVVDIMCGNGRHTRPGMVGADWSRSLLRHVPAPAVQSDATRLPFRDAAFDGAVYVAGLHGIPDASGRAASLAELHRILLPGGVAQVTVWSRDAPRFRDAEGPDVIVPWKAGGHDAHRTYHLYSAKSLDAACKEAGFSEVRIEPVQIAADAPDNLVATLTR